MRSSCQDAGFRARTNYARWPDRESRSEPRWPAVVSSIGLRSQRISRAGVENIQTGHVSEEELDRDQYCPLIQNSSAASRVPRRDAGHAADTKHPWRQCSSRWSEKRRAAYAASAPSQIGPSTISRQSEGIILPSTIVWPIGTCIQLLLARDPERREHGAERHHATGEEVDARRYPIAPKQHDAEKCRL